MLPAFLLSLLGATSRRISVGALALACAFGAAQSRPAFFEVSSATGKVYVLGSIHVGRKDLHPLPAAVEEGWKASKSLAVEADVSDPTAAMAMAPLMICTPPDSLDQHLSPEGWKKAEAQLKHPKVVEGLQKVGLPEAAIKMFRPWALTVTLAVVPVLNGGYEVGSGIDMHFLKRAKAETKAILQIESLDFQAKLLSGMPKNSQEAMLLETLDGLISGKAVKEVSEVIEAWSKGDVDRIHKLMQTSATTPEAKVWLQSLLDGRNPGMADKIAGYLAGSGTVFVVVGAAHVAGPQSVIELLKKRGFKAKRLS